MFNLTAYEKLILFFLGSYTGSNSECYPSIITLAKDCSISVDSIKRHLKSLESKGLVQVSRIKGINNHYKLALPIIDQLGAHSTQCTEHLVQSAPTTRCIEHQVLGAHSTPNNIKEYTSEITSLADNKKLSSVVSFEIHKAKKSKRTKTEYPEGNDHEIIKPYHEELAAKYNLDLQDQFEHFKDHHLAKGSKFLDWSRAFGTWMRNANKFSHNKTNSSSINVRKTYSSEVMRGVR
jgi:hypothetical protein